MTGLGFRPLHYQDGTGPEGVEKPGMTHENALLYIKWLHGEGSESLPPDEQMSPENFAEILAILQGNPEAAITYAERLLGLATPRLVDPVVRAPGHFLPPGTGEYEMRFDRDLPTTSDDEAGAYYGGGIPGPSFVPTGDQTAPDFREMTGPPVTLPPGEEIDLRQPMGYAHGGYASRGTVAGELPRYGHMSVREEGETMGELSKRHRDQDWYRRMGRMRGGLGSLGPRRRRA
jgi:hypothetical protein